MWDLDALLADRLKALRDAIDDPEAVRTKYEQEISRSATGIIRERWRDLRDVLARPGLPLPAEVRLDLLNYDFNGLAWGADDGLSPEHLKSVVTRRADARRLLSGALARIAPLLPSCLIKLASGGFLCGDKFHPLAGRPMQMLSALLVAPGLSLTTNALRKAMEIDDAFVEFPVQVVKDAAVELRRVLRKAIGLGKDYNPVPSIGEGGDLAYRLALPEK
jgi:hypothetical protein